MGLIFSNEDFTNLPMDHKSNEPKDTRQYSCIACGRTHTFDTWSKFLPAWVCPSCQCSHIEEEETKV